MPSIHYSFEAIGTLWEIALYNDLKDPDALEKVIKDRIAIFDKNYSRFRDDSLVAEMAKKSGTYQLPTDAFPLLEMYHKVYKLTDGAVTPLIGKTMEDVGYDATYSLQTAKKIHKAPAWDDIISYDTTSITIKKPALLDFGAAGKGYLVDLVSNLLRKHKIDTFTINAGGDVLHEAAAHTTLRVGLEHPHNPKQVIGVVPIYNQSICGSAGNRRKWGDYHHIINPKTTKPVSDIIATWVIADTALIADALATALFFVPPEKVEHSFSFDYVILNQDFKVKTSPHFNGELFFKT